MSDELVERVALMICEDAAMVNPCSVACALCKVNARAALTQRAEKGGE
jgi:hypothetical protein